MNILEPPAGSEGPETSLGTIPGTISIVSKRKGGVQPRPGETVVDVDRANPVLGNRHILHNHLDEDERARVIAAHKVEFEQDVAVHGPMSQAVDMLALRVAAGESLALRCWCAPRPCHGETYRAHIFRVLGIEMAESTPPGNVVQSNLF